LWFTYVRQEKPSQSALQPIDPIIPEVQKIISPAETDIVSRHWRDPNAINSSAASTRFIPETLLSLFERSSWPASPESAHRVASQGPWIDIAARMREEWR